MNDDVYHLIVGILDSLLWDGDLIGEENLPQNGPAVFIANHLATNGPIGAMCTLPMRLYPWIAADMVDREKAADYLRWDFIERTLKLKPPLSMLVARLLSRITVPLLSSFGTIPAFQGYDDIQGALKTSVDLLKEGKCVFVFPEDPKLPVDEATKMTPFKKGFTRLGELFYTETGECLRFFPVIVHESRKVFVEKPVIFNPKFPPAQERLRIKNLLEAQIRRKYIEVSIEGYMGVIQPD